MADQGFSDTINRTLAFEGGYVNDPVDPGGETNFGISKRSYPDLNIRALTKAEAIEIYRRDYWAKYQFNTLPPAIGGKVFDLGVNMGPGAAIRLLQRAANSVSYKNNIPVDGKMGPQTVKAVAACDQAELMKALRDFAANRYANIIARNPAMERFRNGWLRRAYA